MVDKTYLYAALDSPALKDAQCKFVRLSIWLLSLATILNGVLLLESPCCRACASWQSSTSADYESHFDSLDIGLEAMRAQQASNGSFG